MAQEPTIVKLSTGGEAVLRSFVKIKDRRAARRALFEGQTITVDTNNASSIDEQVDMALINAIDNIDIKIERLLLSFNGNSDDPFDALMESESEEDYVAIQEAVSKIFGDDEESQDAKEKKGLAGDKTTKER